MELTDFEVVRELDIASGLLRRGRVFAEGVMRSAILFTHKPLEAVADA